MIDDLVYDVGMNNGDDTAYYLHRGFRVVAVEADPALVRRARERFRREIESGRLILLDVAVAEEDGELPFWVCETRSEWSSVHRAIAARDGRPHHEVRVTGRTFSSILEEFGVPHYLKIDIEGNDHLCIEALREDDLPRYLSVEQGPRILELLPRLAEIGYTGFKCIGQSHLLPLQLPPTTAAVWYGRAVGLRPRRSAANAAFRLVGGNRALALLLRRMRRRDGWSFPPGSSGPFGEATPGRWLDLEELRTTLDHFHRLRQAGHSSIFWNGEEYSFWADVHARREPR